MTESEWGGLCGTLLLIFQFLYRGIKYGKWRIPPLPSMVVIFLYGAMIPFGVVLITFSLFGKPEMDISQYKLYFPIAGIALLYVSIYGTIEEIRHRDKK